MATSKLPTDGPLTTLCACRTVSTTAECTTCRPGSRNETADTDRLFKLMHEKFPQELVDLVEYWLYEVIFCPRYIHSQRRNEGRRQCRGYPAEVPKVAKPVYLVLSKDIKAKYEARLWGENILFVNAAGRGCSINSFDKLLFRPQRKCIQYIHMKFTGCNANELWREHLDGEHKTSGIYGWGGW